jgi:hypothetical protein
MKTVLELYVATRERFPVLAARADQLHGRRWDELAAESTHVWFESLAETINADMRTEVPFEEHEALFSSLVDAFERGSKEVRSCIDVSFTENLFWNVPPDKLKQYWLPLPQRLKDLYVAFHKRAPL